MKGDVIEMIATTKIRMDLANRKRQPCIDLMQSDRYSRNLEISLYNGGVAFAPPKEAVGVVRCRKADGSIAVYDTLPDGRGACSVSGNKLTVALAPQVTTAAGTGVMTVSLHYGDGVLTSFSVELRIHPLPEGTVNSEEYVNLQSFLPQAKGAKPGQYLRVSGVKDGRVTAVETAYVSGGMDGEAPEYVTREAARLSEAVQQRQNPGTLAFLVCSDIHYSEIHSHSPQAGQSLLHCAQAMEAVRKAVHLDFTANLGDLIWDSGETPRQAMGAMRYVNQLLTVGREPEFHARGNHDCLYSGQGLTEAQIYANVGIYNTGAVYDESNRLGGWCYRDFPAQKIRVICLNTCEDAGGNFAVSDGQIAWLTEVLHLESGWGSIVLSHHPLDWYGSGQPVVQTLAAASGVLCTIHGHVHNYLVGTVAGTSIPRIAVPNVSPFRCNEYGQNGRPENAEGIEFGESETWEKTAESAEDTAFCVFTVDREAGVVYADHYGAGYSRAVALTGELGSHAVRYSLENVTARGPETVSHGAALAVRLEGAEDVTVTMGGTDITGEAVAAGVVAIPAVTGEVVITASASGGTGGEAPGGGEEENPGGGEAEPPAEPVSNNKVLTSIDTDGSVFNGTGYQGGYRLGSSGAAKALEGAVVSGFIAYSGENIVIGGSKASTVGTLGNYLGLYDSSFGVINVFDFGNLATYGCSWAQVGGTYQLTVELGAMSNETAKNQIAGAKYIRCSLGLVEAAGDLTVTLE